jgi:hypothetical protein
MNNKKTSKSVASLASETLKNNNSSEIAKKLAGSALSQVNKNNQTGSELESIASKVLDSPKYSEQTKTLAGSILSQSNKKR